MYNTAVATITHLEGKIESYNNIESSSQNLSYKGAVIMHPELSLHRLMITHILAITITELY